jgi:acyl-CoA synthetase (AMP-forming)/AMP-acid ligase II
VQRATWSGFLRSAEKFADRPALFADGKALTYSELREISCRVAATIQAHLGPTETPLTAVFAHRSPTAFIGVLGSLLAGNGYVPLNRTFPIERTQVMLERSGCRSIVVDQGSLPQLDKLLETASSSLLVLTPDALDFTSYKQQWPQHTFLAAHELKPAQSWRESAVETDSIAYLLFTSGSTGIPKGVAVAQRNVTAFVDYMIERYEITETDRLSQMFDMTFDLSVFDMFVAWERGACVLRHDHFRQTTHQVSPYRRYSLGHFDNRRTANSTSKISEQGSPRWCSAGNCSSLGLRRDGAFQKGAISEHSPCSPRLSDLVVRRACRSSSRASTIDVPGCFLRSKINQCEPRLRRS